MPSIHNRYTTLEYYRLSINKGFSVGLDGNEKRPDINKKELNFLEFVIEKAKSTNYITNVPLKEKAKAGEFVTEGPLEKLDKFVRQCEKEYGFDLDAHLKSITKHEEFVAFTKHKKRFVAFVNNIKLHLPGHKKTANKSVESIKND